MIIILKELILLKNVPMIIIFGKSSNSQQIEKIRIDLKKKKVALNILHADDKEVKKDVSY